jgi:hypothetical protein
VVRIMGTSQRNRRVKLLEIGMMIHFKVWEVGDGKVVDRKDLKMDNFNELSEQNKGIILTYQFTILSNRMRSKNYSPRFAFVKDSKSRTSVVSGI